MLVEVRKNDFFFFCTNAKLLFLRKITSLKLLSVMKSEGDIFTLIKVMVILK